MRKRRKRKARLTSKAQRRGQRQASRSGRRRAGGERVRIRQRLRLRKGARRRLDGQHGHRRFHSLPSRLLPCHTLSEWNGSRWCCAVGSCSCSGSGLFHDPLVLFSFHRCQLQSKQHFRPIHTRARRKRESVRSSRRNRRATGRNRKAGGRGRGSGNLLQIRVCVCVCVWLCVGVGVGNGGGRGQVLNHHPDARSRSTHIFSKQGTRTRANRDFDIRANHTATWHFLGSGSGSGRNSRSSGRRGSSLTRHLGLVHRCERDLIG